MLTCCAAGAIEAERREPDKLVRGYAAKVVELYPYLEETGVIDEILPKKEQAALAKL